MNNRKVKGADKLQEERLADIPNVPIDKSELEIPNSEIPNSERPDDLTKIELVQETQSCSSDNQKEDV